MKLNAGETYTFVAYSVNSTKEEDLPKLLNEDAKLEDAQIEATSADLMYQKIPNITLNYGKNTLNLVLNHKFNSITTTIKLKDYKYQDDIEIIEDVFFNGVADKASLSLNDSTINPIIEKGKTKAEFTIHHNSEWIDPTNAPIDSASATTFLIPNIDNNSITLEFGKIKIGEDTKTLGDVNNQLIIKDIKLKPGVKYTLKLNFQTCLGNTEETTAFDWACRKQTGSQTSAGCLVLPKDEKPNFKGQYVFNDTLRRVISGILPSDNGYQFDIFYLDNSMNTRVNGLPIYDQEIQFQRVSGSLQNIRFIDGDRYGYDAGKLHDIDNTAAGSGIGPTMNKESVAENHLITNTDNTNIPLLRVYINRHGKIFMEEKKHIDGEFIPLELFDIKTNKAIPFKDVKWNRTSTGQDNTVEVNQLVDGPTIMIGKGYGQNKIKCNP